VWKRGCGEMGMVLMKETVEGVIGVKGDELPAHEKFYCL
jgi:hypothetical protein